MIRVLFCDNEQMTKKKSHSNCSNPIREAVVKNWDRCIRKLGLENSPLKPWIHKFDWSIQVGLIRFIQYNQGFSDLGETEEFQDKS